MENQATKGVFMPKMYCSIFGHDYQVSKKVTKHVKEYTCKHCGKQLTTTSDGSLVELTPKFREINLILERIYNTKMKRSKRKISTSSIY